MPQQVALSRRQSGQIGHLVPIALDDGDLPVDDVASLGRRQAVHRGGGHAPGAEVSPDRICGHRS